MQKRFVILCWAAVSALVFSGLAPAQPDVTVSDMGFISRDGTFGGITAYSLSSTSCNIGDIPAIWIANNNQHPVIAGNIYRVAGDGMLSQIGMSWLKHGFCAVNEFTCGPCQQTPCSTLGVNCADTYGTFLNGEQSNLGPRSDVNASTGVYDYPFPTQGQTGNAIYKRCQVFNSDLGPDENPGAQYFATVQYVTTDEAAYETQHNNNSYRRLFVGTFTGVAYDLFYIGATEREQDPIHAWQALAGDVTRTEVATPEVEANGQFVIGTRAVNLGEGWFRYQYAIFNNTSDRSARSLSIPIPAGTPLKNTQFFDARYHSGEPYSGTDWVLAEGGDSVSWVTETFAENENANAIRWGTTYTFGFDAAAPPVSAPVTIGLFKPGPQPDVTFETLAPAADFTPPVTEVSCFFARGSVWLSWVNNDDYTEVEVTRDGAPVATLPGNATSYADTGASEGFHDYEIRGVVTGSRSFASFCDVDVPPTPPLLFRYDVDDQTVIYDVATGVGSFFSTLTLEEDSGNEDYPHGVEGLSMSVAHDSDLVVAVDIQAGEALESVNGGTGPDFFAPAVFPSGVTLGVVIQLQGSGSIAATGAQECATVQYLLNDATLLGNIEGADTPLIFRTGFSNPPVFNALVLAGAIDVIVEPGFGTIHLLPGIDTVFVRGDTSGDGDIGLDDAILDLNYQFLMGPWTCLEAHDVNDDGSITLADPIENLSFQFVTGTPPPPAPYPGCGLDPTPDALGCDGPVSCP